MTFLLSQRLIRSALIVSCLLTLALGDRADAADREAAVRGDKERVEATGYWLYNDLDAAYQQSRQTDKPIIVVLRCLPCDECVKLDDDLIETHPEIKSLLDQFVRVRVVGTNGLDLSTFQYDTDQSFAVFFLNADKTVYGRFGTRSHRTEWLGDVSLDGMARALQAALKLHRQYPSNREALAGKRGDALEFGQPQQFPTLSDRPDRLDYEGDVVKSCIHCHQIGEARRDFYWQQGKPIPEKLMHPYPHPKSIGLILDPRYPARVKTVTADSPAAQAGLESGDDIESMNGQPLISMADVQWVLHQADPNGDAIRMTVRRDDQMVESEMRLPDGWRRWDDPSWRVASWMMRRITTGGARLGPLDAARQSELGVDSSMALEVLGAGKYGKHATARKAGVRPGDILVSFDGRDDLTSEAAVFDHINATRRPGDRITWDVLRDGKKLTFSVPVQQ